MNQALSANGYVQLIRARLGVCKSIPSDEREIPAKSDDTQNLWILSRGGVDQDDPIFENDDLAQQPLPLMRGGSIEFYLRIRRTRRSQIQVASYRIAFMDLPDNDNKIKSLRYDQSEGHPKGEGWDTDLEDNPHHPWAHLHVNFAGTEHANDCRLPTGPVCPILLLCAFDHWYWSTFLV